MASNDRGRITRVAFYTLGCKLNQAETESLADQLLGAGYQLVAPDDMADIYIANTCTVTHVADRQSRQWLRAARRRNPEAVVIATGCYAQRAPRELAQLADLVINNEEKEHLPGIIKNLPLPAACTITANGQNPEAKFQSKQALTPYNTRARSLIKIQDGCLTPCAYCIVPLVRTHEYSLPATWIVAKIKQKTGAGYKEAILTGTKIGCYKDGDTSLEDLIRHTLHDTSIQRLRLSSLQPQEISARFLALWQEPHPHTDTAPRLCRHFHMSLQSGSNTVLQRMKRQYSLDDYLVAVHLIRETVPEAAITTDIMVGFPGETDAEFTESYRFCQQAGFARIHVFPFSPRPGTLAARMPGQVKEQVKKERTHRMLEISRSSRRSFCRQFLGQTMQVLWERELNSGNGIYSGLTDNYIRVLAKSENPLANKIVPVKLASLHDDNSIWGELTGENPN